VDSIDRKLQGRILEAISDIATAPVTTRGDTVKALSGEMSGFWRYRIGDFRLVYYPDETTRTITLYDFASRGSVTINSARTSHHAAPGTALAFPGLEPVWTDIGGFSRQLRRRRPSGPRRGLSGHRHRLDAARTTSRIRS